MNIDSRPMPSPPLPRRGFPLPNPWVRVGRGPLRRLRLAMWATVANAALLVLAVVTAGTYWDAPRGTSQRGLANVGVLTVFAALLAIPVLWLVVRWFAARASPMVVPATLIDPPGELAGCLFGGFMFILLLPVNLLAGIALAIIMGSNTVVGLEYVQDYRVRRVRVRIPRNQLRAVAIGQVVWVVLPSLSRGAAVWSEYHGAGSPWCLASAQITQWHNRAVAKATQTRKRRRKARARNIRRIRARRNQYRSGSKSAANS